MSATESGQWTERICLDKEWADGPDILADPPLLGVGWDDVPARPRMSPGDEDEDDYYDDDDDESDDDMDDYDDDDFDDDDDELLDDDDEDDGDTEDDEDY